MTDAGSSLTPLQAGVILLALYAPAILILVRLLRVRRG